MLVTVYGAKCLGIEAVRVAVEVDIQNGIGIHLVGLADTAVKESLLRIVNALQTHGFRIPGKKIVINLAPADQQKKGSGYDLPIALGIIAASGQASMPMLDNYLIMGELGLDGSVRDIRGALAFAEAARDCGLKGCILPWHSAKEAASIDGIDVYGVRSISDAIAVLSPEGKPADASGVLPPQDNRCDSLLIAPAPPTAIHASTTDAHTSTEYTHATSDTNTSATKTHASAGDTHIRQHCNDYMDMSEIIGQDSAKRGIEIAAAGGHNVLMIGSPGSGKSSLAKAMAGILPPLTTAESLTTTKIYSVAGRTDAAGGLITQRPVRSPHYSISLAAMIGGGSGEMLLPGEVSLAHSGILFIDEFNQMPKSIIEALRGPLEDRTVTLSRLKSKVTYPASFMLVAATNPCPCGYLGEKDRCTCTPGQRNTYLSRLSGPILDRIDIQLWLHPVDPLLLIRKQQRQAESSAAIAARVIAARSIQEQRFKDEPISTNAEMNSRMIDIYCPLDRECREALERLMIRMGFSARAYTRIIKLARTIADLEGATDIRSHDLAEAASYRILDKPSDI